MDYADAPSPGSPNPMFPLRQFLGFEIETGGGSGTVTLELDERHMNPNNIAHGAVTFANEMHTRFHRPAASGRLTTTATVLTGGRRMVHVEAKTVDDQDRLVASASSSFAIITG